MATNPLEGAKRTFDNLNDREKRLVGLLGGVVGVLLLLTPIFLLSSAIGDLEDENREIAKLLRDISKNRPQIEERIAQKEAALRRYDRPVPSIGTFIEEKAGASGLTVRESVDQPDKQLGKYRRESVRVTIPGVGLKPVIEMMAAIENSQYPVAVDRLNIEHYQAGDKYNVQLGISAYMRDSKNDEDD